MPKTGVTVVSVLLVAHSAARRILLRHLQVNEELPPIVMELGYQADQQTVRYLDPRIQLHSGDSLALECQYDTRDRDRSTLGGLGYEDEMCQAFLLYYPRTVLATCATQTPLSLLDLFGIKPINSKHGEITEVSLDGKVTSLRESLLSVDWESRNVAEKIDEVRSELSQKGTVPYCLTAFGDQMSTAMEQEGLRPSQDRLVPLNKVTRCGIWDRALRHDRQRSIATSLIALSQNYTYHVFVSFLIIFLF